MQKNWKLQKHKLSVHQSLILLFQIPILSGNLHLDVKPKYSRLDLNQRLFVWAMLNPLRLCWVGQCDPVKMTEALRQNGFHDRMKVHSHKTTVWSWKADWTSGIGTEQTVIQKSCYRCRKNTWRTSRNIFWILRIADIPRNFVLTSQSKRKLTMFRRPISRASSCSRLSKTVEVFLVSSFRIF